MKKGMALLFIPLLLTGCSANTQGDGFFHQLVVSPLTHLLEFNAQIFNGNYGLGIILATLLLRFLLLPLMAKQYKSQAEMKQKMETIKPEVAAIQEKLKKATDMAEKSELQQELMKLYQTQGINPLNMGCLPMLIQMPILMGFYLAIKGSAEIATHSFLWYSLGDADIIMTLIAGAVYYLQFKMSMSQMPAEQQAQMKIMGLISPMMIMFISFSAPAALPLYWSTSGLFLIVQNMFLRKKYNPKRVVIPSLQSEPSGKK
ncbi:membrane protein insertase YidC [Pradoshia sp.]|uniref:membrane protein insertase YidC n=1 Tax=Pradoshia sp. TaxID=2651281 RepID=UPI003F09C9C3